MKIIYKYELTDNIRQCLEIPANAQILSIQEQHGNVKLWALIDTNEPILRKEIFLIGTGVPFDKSYNVIIENGFLTHLATVQVGNLVYHYFENNAPF